MRCGVERARARARRRALLCTPGCAAARRARRRGACTPSTDGRRPGSAGLLKRCDDARCSRLSLRRSDTKSAWRHAMCGCTGGGAPAHGTRTRARCRRWPRSAPQEQCGDPARLLTERVGSKGREGQGVVNKQATYKRGTGQLEQVHARIEPSRQDGGQARSGQAGRWRTSRTTRKCVRCLVLLNAMYSSRCDRPARGGRERSRAGRCGSAALPAAALHRKPREHYLHTGAAPEHPRRRPLRLPETQVRRLLPALHPPSQQPPLHL